MKFKILLNGIILEQTNNIDKMKTLLSRHIRNGNIHYLKDVNDDSILREFIGKMNT